VYKNASDVLV